MGITQTYEYVENGDWNETSGCKHASRATLIKKIKWKEVEMGNFTINVPSVLSGTSQAHSLKSPHHGVECIEVR